MTAGDIGVSDIGRPYHVTNADAGSPVVLVCEHATHFIPEAFQDLGLTDQARFSHIAWDPGAQAVALSLSKLLDGQLVSGGVSRLVYDCNRPPDAADATPAQSELFDVPGNVDLSDAAKAGRVAQYYLPFRQAVASAMARTSAPVLITIHSFTPVYLGKTRDVDIGILHDTDSRLADQMVADADDLTDFRVARNAPYGPQDGVTHTLKEHALPGNHLNVMIELRNDLIATKDQQDRMARLLAQWLILSLNALGVAMPPLQKGAQCQG